METVIIALGSNEGSRIQNLRDAYHFLQTLSRTKPKTSFIYESEPVGIADKLFLNAAVSIQTEKNAEELLRVFKEFERGHGRPSRYPKWSNRTIDLDLIWHSNFVNVSDSLIIPHKEYAQRLFVLLPLRDIEPHWIDPESGKSIEQLIDEAPDIQISKTKLNW